MDKDLGISVVIITKNEADNIADALKSVNWARDVIVVDSGSTDDTVAIARRYTDRVITRNWQGYGSQKNYATKLALHDWVLSLDADERISPALAQELSKLMRELPTMQGYRIPRTNYYLGRWIRSTDWYPDHQLRLYDRRVSRWNLRHVHESVTVGGAIGTLKSDIHHFSHRSVSHHLSTIDLYTTLWVKQMLMENRRTHWLRLIIDPPIVFLRNYLWRKGFLDGVPGLIVSLMNSYYVLLKFVKLWESQTKNLTRR